MNNQKLYIDADLNESGLPQIKLVGDIDNWNDESSRDFIRLLNQFEAKGYTTIELYVSCDEKANCAYDATFSLALEAILNIVDEEVFDLTIEAISQALVFDINFTDSVLTDVLKKIKNKTLVNKGTAFIATSVCLN